MNMFARSEQATPKSGRLLRQYVQPLYPNNWELVCDVLLDDGRVKTMPVWQWERESGKTVDIGYQC